ncbi:hypothetical protein [Spongorhabdus nitratireducens]
MIRKLTALLAITASITVPVSMAGPGLNLVTSRSASTEATTSTLFVRSIIDIDTPLNHKDIVLDGIPKSPTVPHTGVNNCGFITRHVQVSEGLHVVGTIDGQIHLYRENAGQAGVVASVAASLVETRNLADYGMKPLLQNAALIQQLDEVFPTKTDQTEGASSKELNPELEAFKLRNLGMPIHFSRPFRDEKEGHQPAVFALADNHVFRIVITGAETDAPRMDIRPFPDRDNNVCYVPVTPVDNPWTVASVLNTDARSRGGLKEAAGKNIDDLQTRIFPDYATGISWEKTESEFLLVVTLDSRNGEYATGVDYLTSNEPAGCNGRGIIMCQYSTEPDPSSSTPRWKKHAYSNLTSMWPRPNEQTKLMANSCHSMLTTVHDDQAYLTMQLHHHELAYAPLEASQNCIGLLPNIPTTKAMMDSHPITTGHSPLLLYKLPPAYEEGFHFKFFMSGKIRAADKVSRASENRLQIPYRNGIFIVACTRFDAQKDSPNIKIAALTRGNQPVDAVVSIHKVTMVHGEELDQEAAQSAFVQKRFVPACSEFGRIGVPAGADHAYDFGRIHDHLNLQPLSL